MQTTGRPNGEMGYIIIIINAKWVRKYLGRTTKHSRLNPLPRILWRIGSRIVFANHTGNVAGWDDSVANFTIEFFPSEHMKMIFPRGSPRIDFIGFILSDFM